MPSGIAAWLGRSSPPRHLYELLGVPLLDPDRDSLRQAIAAACRALLDFQAHPDAAVARRATDLLAEVDKARALLDDPDKLRAHDEGLLAELRGDYDIARGRGRVPSLDECAAWLAARHDLRPGDALRVARLLVGDPEPARVPEVPAPNDQPLPAADPGPVPRFTPATDATGLATDAPGSAGPPLVPEPPDRSHQGVIALAVAVGVLLLIGGAILAQFLAGRGTREGTDLARVDPPPTNPDTAPKAAPPDPPKRPTRPDPTPGGDPDPAVTPTPQPGPDPSPELAPAPAPRPSAGTPVAPEPRALGPKPPEKTDWVPQGEVEVRIDSVHVGRVTLRHTFSKATRPSPNDVLVVWVEVRNQGKTDRLLKRWHNEDPESPYATLRAEGKRVVRRASFDNDWSPDWGEYSRKLVPGRPPLRALLVFELPPADAEDLALSLSAERVGGKPGETFYLVLPAEAWKKK